MDTWIGDGVDIEKEDHHVGWDLQSEREDSMTALVPNQSNVASYTSVGTNDNQKRKMDRDEKTFSVPRSKSEGRVNFLRRTEASLASMGSLVESVYFHLNHKERPPSDRSLKRYRCTVLLGGLLVLTMTTLLVTLGAIGWVMVIQPEREEAAFDRAVKAQAARDAALVQQCTDVTWQDACAALSLTSTAGARRRRLKVHDASAGGAFDDDDAFDPDTVDVVEESIEQKFLHSDDPTVVYDSYCIREFRLNMMWDISVPYRGNHLLTSGGTHTMALFIQHGALRDAVDYYCSFMHLIRKQKHHNPADILLIAPHFQYAHDDYLHPRDAFWNTSKPWGDWRNGAESDPKCCGKSGYTVSSFTVLDNMLAILTNKDLYPNMQQISFTGHSAGGQMVQRYAVISTLAALWDLGLDIKMRFVIANPSSYTYLDNRRFEYNCGECSCNRRECICDKDCTPQSIELAVPTHHGAGSKHPCYQWNYDRWPYGLGNFISRYGLHIPYALREGLAGPERAVRTYGKLDVVYMVGHNDTCNDGLPHCDASCWKRDHWLPGENRCFRNQMDTRCPAMLQGPNRRLRAHNYMNYLQQFYKKPTHTLYEVPEVGHNVTAMFESDIGLEVLFGP
eukprot:Nitzschia sp. Nitz4//scaffold62_size106224//70401//72257//NITZ4_004362-RA/size106224-processed-gene-0.34-mRNA-1//1//CDS//3329555874//7118//frame0